MGGQGQDENDCKYCIIKPPLTNGGFALDLDLDLDLDLFLKG